MLTKKLRLITVLLTMVVVDSYSQSFELMPGTKRIFVDLQWLKPLDEERHWTLFSRSRATTDYDENTDLFTGAYLNYTTSSGIGGTLLGTIANTGAGSDLGVHLFKANDRFMIFALASVGLRSGSNLSWFSIMRYTPKISDDWRLYSSLELFSTFGSGDHVASVQRIRLGFDRGGYQFGIGINLSGTGRRYNQTDDNPGVFLRKQF